MGVNFQLNFAVLYSAFKKNAFKFKLHAFKIQPVIGVQVWIASQCLPEYTVKLNPCECECDGLP